MILIDSALCNVCQDSRSSALLFVVKKAIMSSGIQRKFCLLSSGLHFLEEENGSDSVVLW